MYLQDSYTIPNITTDAWAEIARACTYQSAAALAVTCKRLVGLFMQYLHYHNITYRMDWVKAASAPIDQLWRYHGIVRHGNSIGVYFMGELTILIIVTECPQIICRFRSTAYAIEVNNTYHPVITFRYPNHSWTEIILCENSGMRYYANGDIWPGTFIHQQEIWASAELNRLYNLARLYQLEWEWLSRLFALKPLLA